MCSRRRRRRERRQSQIARPMRKTRAIPAHAMAAWTPVWPNIEAGDVGGPATTTSPVVVLWVSADLDG